MKIETIAIHAGQEPDPSTGAIMTPVYQTSTYVQKAPGEHLGYEYSRSQNPTREALEGNLAALEGAAYGYAFASGCAAMTTLMHMYKQGDHILCGDDVYGGTYRLFTKVLSEMGLEFTFVDTTDLEKVREAIRPNTKAMWLETPTNPMMKVSDLRALSALAHERQVTVFCDNTFATPIFQRPLELGCDVVVHSTTKYLNGHSDVVGGFAATNDKALGEKIAFNQNSIGAVPGPWDSWLVLRGTKTLAVRMKAHNENGMAVAEFLEAHPRVKTVYYPGLKSHPQYVIAQAQMSGAGGMISFVIDGTLDDAKTFLMNLKIFALAESLGGVESLAEHPAIMTHASVPPEVREELGIDDGLVRLSCGIEAMDDLIDDLKRGFEAINS